jgi:hypothetical protein
MANATEAILGTTALLVDPAASPHLWVRRHYPKG